MRTTARHSEAESGPRPRLSLKGVTILLVEDHASSREATRQLLRSLGARVLVAADGLDALGLLSGRWPHLILCDLRMPRMDGFELMRRLAGDPRRAGVPVVALTGFADERAYLRTLDAGFDGHLTKPLDVPALLRFVNR